MPQYLDRRPTFDARVWNVPNRMEATNNFLWREWDATKNSVSMAASALYSPKQMLGKHSGQLQAMLLEKDVNWNDYPASFKRGTYVQRQVTSASFTADEIQHLPERHAARTNPDLKVERSIVTVLDMPPLGTVTNREEVIFHGAKPLCGVRPVCL